MTCVTCAMRARDRAFRKLLHTRQQPLDLLKSRVLKFSYDYEQRRGVVYQPPCCCTDFEEVVEFFRKIDHQVQVIHTMAGDEADTVYRFINEEWVAHMPRG